MARKYSRGERSDGEGASGSAYSDSDLDETPQLERRNTEEYVPGYDWIPGRFGPSPGIPKDVKDKFDRMSDKEYLHAFLKLSQEEKESLMVSEAERRRTFAAHWSIETIVKANDCAKEGFYYTGMANRVQCAFCGGIIRNWERGDVPKFQHKNFFNHCKIIQNMLCQNIPISNRGLPRDLMTTQLSSAVRNDARPVSNDPQNMNGTRAMSPAMSAFSKRKETYRRYPNSHPMNADDLCHAGFLYEDVGDKVKCFHCDGALEMWHEGDDPWTEHAKWYPGCHYVQQSRGLDFIRAARVDMAADNLAAADTLIYNKGDVSFLDMLCQNIPISNRGLPRDLMTTQLSSAVRNDARPVSNDPQNMNGTRAMSPAMSEFSKRKETYRRYPNSHPVNADDLCHAGFFYEDVGDKVKCFHCDGALEMWHEGDDPWTEHAKWYPGCRYVQQSRGLDFIRAARVDMTADNLAAADTLIYNKGDVSFLDDGDAVLGAGRAQVETFQGYAFCSDLEYRHGDIREAYRANGDVEFEDQQALMGIVQDLSEGNRTSLEQYRQGVEHLPLEQAMHVGPGTASQPPRQCLLDSWLTFCRDVGHDEALIQAVYEANGRNGELYLLHTMLSIILDLEDGNTTSLDALREERRVPPGHFSVPAFIMDTNDPTAVQSRRFIAALMCKMCNNKLAQGVFLFCGCYCVCYECSRGMQPDWCPACGKVVKGVFATEAIF